MYPAAPGGDREAYAPLLDAFSWKSDSAKPSVFVTAAGNHRHFRPPGLVISDGLPRFDAWPSPDELRQLAKQHAARLPSAFAALAEGRS